MPAAVKMTSNNTNREFNVTYNKAERIAVVIVLTISIIQVGAGFIGLCNKQTKWLDQNHPVQSLLNRMIPITLVFFGSFNVACIFENEKHMSAFMTRPIDLPFLRDSLALVVTTRNIGNQTERDTLALMILEQSGLIIKEQSRLLNSLGVQYDVISS